MRRIRKWLAPVLVFFAAAMLILFCAGHRLDADETALSDLISDENVTVSRTRYGWFFDGPSSETALIFYPGALVDARAYAPLLHRLAEEGMDACLAKMPFRLALFGINSADEIMKQYEYCRWYIGGHSLGGAMAAEYAANHADRLSGLILLAAYPTRKLDPQLTEISIYGSEDGVINRNKLESGKKLAPDTFLEFVIEGGNHAQFGSYGIQRGDAAAAVSQEEQQRMTVEYIISNVRSGA